MELSLEVEIYNTHEDPYSDCSIVYYEAGSKCCEMFSEPILAISFCDFLRLIFKRQKLFFNE